MKPRLAALTAGLAPAHCTTHDGWPANDVLAHLRACADMWGNCIVAIIAEDMPTLRAVNPTTWIKWLARHERQHLKQVERILNATHL